MQLVGGNADLRPQAVLEAIGETGRGVDHHRGGIDFGEEAPGIAEVLGDDGVGVLRAVGIDVQDGLVQPVDDADREDRRVVLGAPVFLGRFQHVIAQQRASGGVATQLHALVAIDGGQRRQHTLGNGGVHQQGFHGVAGRVTLGLGVVGHANGLVQVGGDVDVDVADAVQVLDHRHLGLAADALDQALAAARDYHVDVLGHADQRADGGAVGGLDHLHQFGRQLGLGQALLDAGGNGAVGMDGLGAAAQDGGVARLQAEAGGVDGHVRPRLVDDADHAQRYAHLADLDAGRQVAHVTDLADGVRQGGDLAQALDHVVDTCRGQGQAVEHGWFQAIGAAIGQVLLVGGGQLGTSAIQGIGGSQQGAVLLRGAGTGGHARGGASGAAQAGHVIENGLSHGHAILAVEGKRQIIATALARAQRRLADGRQTIPGLPWVTAQTGPQAAGAGTVTPGGGARPKVG
ncbi:hypothetical protein D3C80_444140 [compost metagenome]